jgi:hypothetical protein
VWRGNAINALLNLSGLDCTARRYDSGVRVKFIFPDSFGISKEIETSTAKNKNNDFKETASQLKILL